MHGAHLVRMYMLPHGGLTSLNLRADSIIQYETEYDLKTYPVRRDQLFVALEFSLALRIPRQPN